MLHIVNLFAVDAAEKIGIIQLVVHFPNPDFGKFGREREPRFIVVVQPFYIRASPPYIPCGLAPAERSLVEIAVIKPDIRHFVVFTATQPFVH